MIEVPTLKITLNSLETSLIHHFGEMMNDIEKLIKQGIQEAIVTLPELIKIRCKTAIENAVEEVTYKATKDYFANEGYDRIYNQVRELHKGSINT
jgi:hypothetical protein